MGFRHNINLDQMLDDIIKAAEVAEVKYDKQKIQKVLSAFSDFYSGSAITFVTSTKPKDARGLSVRYVELSVPHDPLKIALENGIITKDDHPIFEFYPEIHATYPMMGYGVDMDANFGLTKIWTFFQIPTPIQKAYHMTHAPDGIRKYADYFTKYGLEDFSLFALDFKNRTTNIYFMVDDPSRNPPEKVAGMIGDLDFKVPSEEVLEHCSKAITIYYTFSWDSDIIERVCFGTTALNPGEVPTHLDPLIEKYVKAAPTLADKQTFIYSITPSRKGDYIKIENDYSGSMIELMTQGANAGIVLDELKSRVGESAHEGKELVKTVDWEDGVYELFENLTAKVPDVFRAMVKPMLHETAENKCKERNAGAVSETDLVLALFDITPEPFKPDAYENLKAAGIDYQKYLELYENSKKV
ncbi:MAG: hypothetical protein JSV49_03095 [Thermoplasmata archaeon]|nr:MAG: hypothetical protein JSV49_03095 [Thermoplasmata archaeon]